jgi:carbamoyltransferase
MQIFGISAFGRDRAAALVKDGEVVAAAREDRFTRESAEDGFPRRAVDWCLAEAGSSLAQVDLVAVAEKPLRRFERTLETVLALAPGAFKPFAGALPTQLGRRLTMAREVDKALGLDGKRYIWIEQAEAHAAAAWHATDGAEAAILVMDGDGEWATTALGHGRGGRVELHEEQRHPHSLGLAWQALASHLGFAPVGGVRKAMDLARLGQPKLRAELERHFLRLDDDGSFALAFECIVEQGGATTTSASFRRRFGAARHPYDPLATQHKDLAASLLALHEDVLLRTARRLHARTGAARLVVSGSLAACESANGRLLREGPFREVLVQPAATGGSLALGAALMVERQLLGGAGARTGPWLGPRASSSQAKPIFAAGKAAVQALDRAALARAAVAELAAGRIVAWCQGRAELAAHSLGARCLVADPRLDSVRDRMELRVRFQQSFAPLRALVRKERASECFELPAGADLAAGLIEVRIKEPARLPAIASADGLARVQAVDAALQPELAALLEAWERESGVPVLATEGFALGSGPLVLDARDAWITFMTGECDALAFGDSWLLKREQPCEREARRRDPRAADPANLDDDPALRELLRCPACGGAFEFSGAEAAACKGCGAKRVREEGLWRMFQPDAPYDGDITQMVKSFYEAHPFPGYDESDTAQTMVEEARAGIYARQLGEQIPFNGRVLEVGCGTGQLSNYLGIAARTQFGADLCLNSLRLAEGFRSRQRLNHVRLVQMNLFKPCFAPESFDVVLCNGVLLTTSDPEGGFRSIARLVKPGGHIVIGSYNTYGRLGVDARRVFFRLTGGRMRWVDPYIRKVRMSPEKEDAWFHDQYLHPNETKQSMGEILGWFDRAGIEFVNAVPKTTPWESYTEEERLFEKAMRGGKFERALVQLQMIKTGNQEGGFFIMIGRKPGGGS